MWRCAAGRCRQSIINITAGCSHRRRASLPNEESVSLVLMPLWYCRHAPAPVVYEEASLARYRYAPLSSLTWPCRPSADIR
jgi:hypothetical protein